MSVISDMPDQDQAYPSGDGIGDDVERAEDEEADPNVHLGGSEDVLEVGLKCGFQ